MSEVRDRDDNSKEMKTLLATAEEGVRSTGPAAVVVRVPRTIGGLVGALSALVLRASRDFHCNNKDYRAGDRIAPKDVRKINAENLEKMLRLEFVYWDAQGETSIAPTYGIPRAPRERRDRTIALGLLAKGLTSSEAARAVGKPSGTVRRWKGKRVAATASAAPIVYVAERPAPDGSGPLTEDDREELASLFGNDRRQQPKLVASLLDNIDRELGYSKAKERKQTREPRKNARGPNRQARNGLRDRASWIHDVGFVGDESDRRNFKAEFVDLVLQKAGYPALKLKRGEMPTPNESWAVHETLARSRTAIDLGRALRQGVPLLRDLIWERTEQAAAAARLSVPRYVKECPEGTRLANLHQEHFFTPIDTARKDAALSEECGRVGVRLN